MQSTQSYFTLPLGQGVHFARACFTLPWGHRLHSLHWCFCLPCEHQLVPVIILLHAHSNLRSASHDVRREES